MSTAGQPYFEARQQESQHIQTLSDVSVYLDSLSHKESDLPSKHEDWCACQMLKTIHTPYYSSWMTRYIQAFTEPNYYRRRTLGKWKDMLIEIGQYMSEAEKDDCRDYSGRAPH